MHSLQMLHFQQNMPAPNKLAVMLLRYKYSQGLLSDLSAVDSACIFALRLRADVNVLVD